MEDEKLNTNPILRGSMTESVKKVELRQNDEASDKAKEKTLEIDEDLEDFEIDEGPISDEYYDPETELRICEVEDKMSNYKFQYTSSSNKDPVYIAGTSISDILKGLAYWLDSFPKETEFELIGSEFDERNIALLVNGRKFKVYEDLKDLENDKKNIFLDIWLKQSKIEVPEWFKPYLQKFIRHAANLPLTNEHYQLIKSRGLPFLDFVKNIQEAPSRTTDEIKYAEATAFTYIYYVSVANRQSQGEFYKRNKVAINFS